MFRLGKTAKGSALLVLVLAVATTAILVGSGSIAGSDSKPATGHWRALPPAAGRDSRRPDEACDRHGADRLGGDRRRAGREPSQFDRSHPCLQPGDPCLASAGIPTEDG